MVAGLVFGLYEPKRSINLPSLGERESATTTWKKGFPFLPNLCNLILVAILFLVYVFNIFPELRACGDAKVIKILVINKLHFFISNKLFSF